MVSWPVPTAGWLAKKTTRLSVLPVPVPLVVRSAALALEPPILNVGDVSILRVRPRRSNVVPLDGSPIDLGTPAKEKRKRGYSIYNLRL